MLPNIFYDETFGGFIWKNIVEIVLENAEEEYFFYMVIKRDPSIGDYVYERGQLQREINKVKTLGKNKKR